MTWVVNLILGYYNIVTQNTAFSKLYQDLEGIVTFIMSNLESWETSSTAHWIEAEHNRMVWFPSQKRCLF